MGAGHRGHGPARGPRARLDERPSLRCPGHGCVPGAPGTVSDHRLPAAPLRDDERDARRDDGRPRGHRPRGPGPVPQLSPSPARPAVTPWRRWRTSRERPSASPPPTSRTRSGPPSAATPCTSTAPRSRRRSRTGRWTASSRRWRSGRPWPGPSSRATSRSTRGSARSSSPRRRPPGSRRNSCPCCARPRTTRSTAPLPPCR